MSLRPFFMINFHWAFLLTSIARFLRLFPQLDGDLGLKACAQKYPEPGLHWKLHSKRTFAQEK